MRCTPRLTVPASAIAGCARRRSAARSSRGRMCAGRTLRGPAASPPRSAVRLQRKVPRTAELAMANDIVTSTATPLSTQELSLLHAWWRAANYLSIGQIYLLDNPLLQQPLELSHIKPRLLGHWGTTPGLNFIYVHLNRLIKSRDLNMIYI